MDLGQRKAKDFKASLVLVIGSVICTLLLLEAIIHIFEAYRGPLFLGGEETLQFMQGHPIIGWEHRPDFSQRYGWPEHPTGYVEIRTNNLGLREDSDTALTKPAGIYRILVLGDSHTDGLVHNQESWPNVLEQLLNERSPLPGGQHYEVLNAGVSGYQPIHEYLWWRQYGQHLKPDLVILGYYLGNDLVGAGGQRLFKQKDNVWSLDEEPWSTSGTVNWKGRIMQEWRQLRRSCRLCALVSYGLHQGLLKGPTLEEGRFVIGSTKEERTQHLTALRYCLGCVWQSLEQQWLLERTPAKYEADLEATQEVLRRLQYEIEATGATFLVLVIPSKLQVEGDSSGQATQTARILNITLQNPSFEERIASELASISDQYGILTLEALPELKESYSRHQRPLYYDADWHLNVEGNQMVGLMLYQALNNDEQIMASER